MTQDWSGGVADWWQHEVESDAAYRDEVLPLLLEVMPQNPTGPILDVGAGQGWVSNELSSLGMDLVACDLSEDLAKHSARHVPTVVCRLPELGWIADEAMAGAVVVLVLEHMADVRGLFMETSRVVAAGGFLTVVVNHPFFTAPGSGPVVDPTDGEMLWRMGEYFADGYTDERAGGAEIRFHHRSFGELLTVAASAGWVLHLAVEAPVGEARALGDPLLATQRDVPRLLGLRWHRRLLHSSA